MSYVPAYTLTFDSWAARWEAIKAIEDYTALLRCDCDVFRPAGLRCATCGREPPSEEIPEEEGPAEVNRAACPTNPRLSP